ncbi:MAG: type I-MYXAN CRISPR-associated protein Cas6/Cmx6 [Halobacteria archaeon]|nr:type I-MYXAN CRISPR-associated protein Cas6/Cmx6 [Halobacteria archaeon]
MLWSEESKTSEYVVPDDVVDLAFAIKCPVLPIDHAHVLSVALQAALPWLKEEKYAGIHLIHGAASGNGWYRPDDTADQLLQLSRRARLRLRVPKERLDDARELTGRSLDLDGYVLEVGKADLHLFTALPTLFSRYVMTRVEVDEEDFLQQAVRELEVLGIACRKMLCGITHTLNFPDGPVFTRSLMVADLEPEASVRLQQVGLGQGRKIGCGLFIPHKGIKPVKEEDG